MRNKLSIGGAAAGGSNGISLSASMNVKSLISPMNSKKKVEGFDRTASSQMFSSKVNKLKNKPKMEGLEEQYIGGLQDEIKYLEMELKLLQEKDQERHGQVDQLEKVEFCLFSSLETAFLSTRTSWPSKTGLTTTKRATSRRLKVWPSRSRKEVRSSMDWLARLNN